MGARGEEIIRQDRSRAGRRPRYAEGDRRRPRETTVDVRTIRQASGITQAAFAEAFGLRVAALRDWEQGRRRPDTGSVALIAAAARHDELRDEAFERAAEVGADHGAVSFAGTMSDLITVINAVRVTRVRGAEPYSKKPFSYSHPICFILPDDARTARIAHLSGRHGHCEHWDHSREVGAWRARRRELRAASPRLGLCFYEYGRTGD